MVPGEAGVEDGHPHPLPRVPHAPEDVSMEGRGHLAGDGSHETTTSVPVSTRLREGGRGEGEKEGEGREGEGDREGGREVK